MLWLVENGEHVGWFGADPEVGVGFRKEDSVGLINDKYCWERKAPARFGGVVITQTGIVEGDVDEDGLVVTAEALRNSVGYAKSLCDSGAGIDEQGILQAVLFESEAILASGLRGYGDKDGATL